MKKPNGWTVVDTSVGDDPRLNKLQQFIAGKPFGFLRDTDMPALIELDRLMPCLVRCQQCRFTCAAQDVEHLLKCVRAGGDHVRDVSMATGYVERAANWHPPGVAMSKPSPDLALSTEAGIKAKAPQTPWWREHIGVRDRYADECHSDADPGL